MKIYKTNNLKYSDAEFHDFWATDYSANKCSFETWEVDNARLTTKHSLNNYTAGRGDQWYLIFTFDFLYGLLGSR